MATKTKRPKIKVASYDSTDYPNTEGDIKTSRSGPDDLASDRWASEHLIGLD